MGRLLELERQFQHLEKLRQKVRRCKHYQEGMTAAQAADNVQSICCNKNNRLRQNTAEVCRWVRNQPATPSVNMYDDELDPEGASSSNAHFRPSKPCGGSGIELLIPLLRISISLSLMAPNVSLNNGSMSLPNTCFRLRWPRKIKQPDPMAGPVLNLPNFLSLCGRI